MKTKRHAWAIGLIIIILLVVSFTDISSKDRIAGLFAKPSETKNILTKLEPSISEEVEYDLSKFTLVEPIEKPDADNLVSFSNQYVFFKYPADWLVGVYGSNGYPAIGIYDPVSQEQKTEGDLRQGVKIQISICDCAPETDFKNTILQRVSGGPEKITKVSEELFDFYRDKNKVNAIATNFATEYGGGQSLRFIGRDGLLYTLSWGAPDFRKLSGRNTQEYQSIFQNILQSFTLANPNK